MTSEPVHTAMLPGVFCPSVSAGISDHVAGGRVVDGAGCCAFVMLVPPVVEVADVAELQDPANPATTTRQATAAVRHRNWDRRRKRAISFL
ncbi:MAG: hypothetical protein M0Z62_04890 [Actinomycetota bacterium]|nr:hypothetical protein [Actinomycetota bacterium]